MCVTLDKIRWDIACIYYLNLSIFGFFFLPWGHVHMVSKLEENTVYRVQYST